MGREGAVQLDIVIALFGEPHMADGARHNGEFQRSAFQILRRGQHAGGDPAVVNEAVLHRAHQQIDPFAAQAAPLRLVRNPL